MDAMVEEYTSIMRNDVWYIVSRPKGETIESARRLYKIKLVVDGSIKKFKPRFVARRFSQKEAMDYDKTFTLDTKYTSIRANICLVLFMEWRIHQMNVRQLSLIGSLRKRCTLSN